MRYYFLQPDYDGLLEHQKQLEEKVAIAKEAKGEAASQSSETWHDNAPYDEAARELNLQLSFLVQVRELIHHALVEDPRKYPEDKVTLGKKVTYRDSAGKTHTVRIGSYRTYKETGGDVQVASYNSDVGKLLLGLEEGDEKRGIINGKSVTIEVIKIE